MLLGVSGVLTDGDDGDGLMAVVSVGVGVVSSSGMVSVTCSGC